MLKHLPPKKHFPFGFVVVVVVVTPVSLSLSDRVSVIDLCGCVSCAVIVCARSVSVFVVAKSNRTSA